LRFPSTPKINLKKRLIRSETADERQIEFFKNYRNHLTKLIKIVKNNYYKKQLENTENDFKNTWKIINEAAGLKTSKSSKINSIHLNGRNIDNSKEIAEEFNSYFINVGMNMSKQTKNSINLETNNLYNVPSSMFIPPIEKKDIIMLINRLNSNSAPGIDGIQARTIKAIHPQIVEPLKHIINLIITTGKVPKYFKETVVTPIHKSEHKNDMRNYRPISQINCFAKVLEMYLKKCLLSFVELNNLISCKQFGFMKGLSTEQAINKLVNRVLEGFNNNECTVALFLDLAKAFDTIPHGKLIMKLERFGIRSHTRNLFENYLSDRYQRVRVNGHLSKPEKIQIGIPQGTVLGPILFLIYINDMYTACQEGEIISYADDTAILYTAPNWQAAKLGSERCLAKIKQWLDENLLTLNVQKTKFLTFSIKANKQPHFTTLNLPNNMQIKKVTEIKYLGVMLDQYLRWDVHANYISNKLRKTLYIFYTLRNILTKGLLKIIYGSLIESILRYGIIAWGSALQTHLLNLQITQNYILKVILGLDRLYPTVDLYCKYGFLNLKNLYTHTLLCWIHKSRNKQTTISHRYPTRANVHQNLTRSKYNKNICQRQAEFQGSKYYNKLPNYIKSIKNNKLFSKSTKKYVIENSDVLP